MTYLIAGRLDMERLGIQGIYLIGSVKRYLAAEGSDIDLMIHFRGNDLQKSELLEVLRGWGEWLAVINREVTGYKSENLLDIHLITDDDIQKQTSFAVLIQSLDDRAKPIRLS